ncbi:hypothetical protein CDL12_11719 [Handroanthus impetiginosus]|uniref:Uncharacterized protein n=1 Tax=Handroanthus impetiginosus TaxID=429701 RepID=A0A2G9HDP8_9LAMI|nr:hypothetical protein CDL12_11719 [Handroanthus impetiginosus]
MVTITKSPQPAEPSTHGQTPPPNYAQAPPPDYDPPLPPTYFQPPPPPPPTVIVVQAPPPVEIRATVPAWSTGLYDCFDDVPNCIITSLVPCVTFGQIAEIVDKGSAPCEACAASYAVIALLTGLPCLKSCVYRSKLRREYNLPAEPCNDCMVHCCCELCALCQEYRELQNRGFNMYLGWQGNAETHNQGVTTMAPSVNGGMNR